MLVLVRKLIGLLLAILGGTGGIGGGDVIVVVSEVEHLPGAADPAAEVVLAEDEAHACV